MPDERAQNRGILVRPLIAQVEEDDLADEALQAGRDVLEPGRGEGPHDGGGVPKIGIQGATYSTPAVTQLTPATQPP